MESILDSKKGRCFVCGRYCETELHHIFYGTGRRKIADRLGLTVYLCPECHRGTYGVHGTKGKELGLSLKRRAQAVFEETHSREEFVKEIGRNYL